MLTSRPSDEAVSFPASLLLHACPAGMCMLSVGALPIHIERGHFYVQAGCLAQAEQLTVHVPSKKRLFWYAAGNWDASTAM